LFLLVPFVVTFFDHLNKPEKSTCEVHWAPGSRAQHLPLHVPSSGGCREQGGRPTASCFPNQTDPEPSAAPQRTCLPAPAPALGPPWDVFKSLNVLFKLWDSTQGRRGGGWGCTVGAHHPHVRVPPPGNAAVTMAQGRIKGSSLLFPLPELARG